MELCISSFIIGLLSCALILRILGWTNGQLFQLLLGVSLKEKSPSTITPRAKSFRSKEAKNVNIAPKALPIGSKPMEETVKKDVEKKENTKEEKSASKDLKEAAPKPDKKESESLNRTPSVIATEPTTKPSDHTAEPKNGFISRKESSHFEAIPRQPRETLSASASNFGSFTSMESPMKEKKICGKKVAAPLVVFPGTPTKTPTFHSIDFKKSKDSADPRDKYLKHGWLEIGTKVGGQKLIWHRSYFCLQTNWLSYYKNEQIRGDQCLGWVCLSGCQVYELQGSKKPKLVIESPKHRIFHKRGPDSNAPPCSKKHYIFHKRSSKCRLRIGDQETLDDWVRALKLGADNKSIPDTPLDSSDDEISLPRSLPTFPVYESRSRSSLSPPKANSVGSLNATVDTASTTFTEPPSSFSEPAVERKLTTPSKSFIDKDSDSDDDSDNPEIEEENRENLLKMVKKAIGLDITTISLPVSLNEPTSFLMRMCENFNNIDLLDQADLCEEPELAMVYVSTFAIASWSNVVRTTKPFNPYLGETYQYIDGRFRFLAEQVSHHPPIGACFAENDHFSFWQEQGIKTKFQGNSLLCESSGRCHLVLKRSGHHYSWAAIKSVVHNVILGKMWIDHFGDTEILNHATGVVGHLDFKKCGWFGKGRYEVSAVVLDTAGKIQYNISGKWNDTLKVTSSRGHQFDGPVWVHQSKPDPSNYWGLPEFCQKLFAFDEQLAATLPRTDSRFRPDRIALEKRDMKTAASEKRRLEDKERKKKKDRDQRGEVWLPKYFMRREDDGFGGKDYEYNGCYWKDDLQTAT